MEDKTAPPGLRVLLADDNPLVCQGLSELLRGAGMDVVGVAHNGSEARALIAARRPDVAVLDVRMPEGTGIAVAAAVSMSTPCVMVTYDDEPATVEECAAAGASGYLVYGEFEPRDLLRAIDEAASGGAVVSSAAAAALLARAGEADGEDSASINRRTRAVAERYGLTTREQDVLHLVAHGDSNQAIARELSVSEKTVKNAIHRLYIKLGVGGRPEAIALFLGGRPSPLR
ncbi:MAG: response regulator transcription factor [Actinomycetota bacterium]